MKRVSSECVSGRGHHTEAVHGGLDPSELAHYGVAIDTVLDFSSNLLPFGPAPSVRRAVESVSLDRYPDRDCNQLRDAIANRYGVDRETLLVGNGCSELIHLVASAFVDSHRHTLIVGPTFTEYQRATRIAGGTVRFVTAEANDGFAVDVDVIDHAVSSQTSLKVVWICNPNNPTGQSVAKSDLVDLIQRHPHVVFVVDESYIEFAENTESLLDTEHENLVVLRSMTKAYCIAGLRLGFAKLPENLHRTLRGRRIPWSVNSIAQAAGVAAIQDVAYYSEAMGRLQDAKQDFLCELTARSLTPLASDTGFFLLPVNDASGIRKQLIAQGMVVRDCHSFGLDNFLRIAVLAPSHNRRLVAALTRLRSNSPSPTLTPSPLPSLRDPRIQ